MEDASKLPAAAPGHWDTGEGRQIAERYAGKERRQLGYGQMSDFAFANAQYMVDRHAFELIVYQTAAKDRIRWLSVQLALAQQAKAELAEMIDAVFAEDVVAQSRRLLTHVGPIETPGQWMLRTRKAALLQAIEGIR